MTIQHEVGGRWSRERASTLLFDNMLLVALVVMVLGFSLADSRFGTSSNFENIALQSTTLAIIAAPASLLIISGQIDLSVGSVMALSAVTAGYLMTEQDWGGGAAIIASLCLAALVGVVNGLLVTIGVNSIVVTLGMTSIARGVTYMISSAPLFGFAPAFLALGSQEILGFSLPVWLALAVFVLAGLFLNLTPSGRHVYAVGTSREAAYLAGIRVRLVPFLLFVVTASAAGLAGLVLASRLDSAPPGTLGVGFELQVLTAVLLGGVSFEGGRGGLFGVALAVLFLSSLTAGLTIVNAANAWQQVAQGAALIIAVGLDLLRHHTGRRTVLPWPSPLRRRRPAAEPHVEATTSGASE